MISYRWMWFVFSHLLHHSPCAGVIRVDLNTAELQGPYRGPRMPGKKVRTYARWQAFIQLNWFTSRFQFNCTKIVPAALNAEMATCAIYGTHMHHDTYSHSCTDSTESTCIVCGQDQGTGSARRPFASFAHKLL